MEVMSKSVRKIHFRNPQWFHWKALSVPQQGIEEDYGKLYSLCPRRRVHLWDGGHTHKGYTLTLEIVADSTNSAGG